MLYAKELIYAYWRRMRDAVAGLFRPAAAPAQLPEPLDRARLFQQLTELRAGRAEDVRRYQQAIEALTRELLPAQAAVDTLRRALREAHADEFSRSLNGTTSENAILRALEGRTPMMLARFMEEIGHEIERLQRTAPTTVIGMHREGRAVKPHPSVQSDGPSLHHRLTALHHARQRAEAMVFEPLTVEQMHREVLRLRHALPQIEQEIFCNERVAILTAY